MFHPDSLHFSHVAFKFLRRSFVRSFVRLFVCLFVCLFIYLFIYLSTITLLKKIQYTIYNPILHFIHRTAKKKRKTTYKGLNKELNKDETKIIQEKIV